MIAHDSSIFAVHAGIRKQTLLSKIPSLNNSGDLVAIRDASGTCIDSVAYSPSWGGNSGGKSLERILPSGESTDPQNFDTCTDSLKSTPGKINSLTPRDYDLAVATISCSPPLLQSGGRVELSTEILNVGLKISDNSTVYLFEDRDLNGLPERNEYVDSTNIPPIRPGDSITVTFSSRPLRFGLYHFGIILQYAQDQRPQNNFRVIPVKVGMARSSIVINEIMYAPKAPEQEWLEIYNTLDTIVDLSRFRIATHGGSEKVRDGTLLMPNSLAVFCRDSSPSQYHYHVPWMIIQSIPSLSNNGDSISIYDDAGNLLDAIYYLPSYGGSNGKSLERIDFLAPGDSSNWAESVDSTGATPGSQNSVAILPYDLLMSGMDLPTAATNPGDNIEVTLEFKNRGRNPIGNFRLSAFVKRLIDSAEVYSYDQQFTGVLRPFDSSSLSFTLSLFKAGLYRINADISSSLDSRKRNDTTSSILNVKFPPRSVTVNEIMFTSGPLGEYFEVFNSGVDPIDLTDWTYHTTSTQSKPVRISPGHRIILPNNFFVVAADTAILHSVSDTSCVQISRQLTLRDDGDCIVLIDPARSVIDSVSYSPSWHNADIVHTAGRSLEKINPSLPSNDRSSWSTCVAASGGTPGKRNSLFVDAGAASGGITVAPNPFSPDGDGHDDFTFINYSYPVSSVKIRMRIFDSMGRLVATPVDNVIVPSTGRLVWDGRDGSGKIVKFGLYILFLEVTGSDGKSLCIYKKPLVVAKKMR